MKKNLIFRLFLIAFLFTMMYSCRTEEELKSRTSEISNVHYGISGDALLSTQFFKSLKSNNSKVASSLSPEELVERLDLDKAHVNSKEGKEVLQVPVRTFGSYKRTLFSVSENGNASVFLFTYPDPNDSRLFYITDLDGNLVKEIKIGDDGKEITTTSKLNKNNVAGKSECEEVIFETCSSGQHSFETGNAYQCEFWHNLTKGTPPKLFRVSGICITGGGGGPIGGGGGSGGHPAGGSTTTPVGGGGPPKHQITPADCVQNLDCGSCNIPGDFNNDCRLSYDEVMALNTNPCSKIQDWFNNPKFKEKYDKLTETSPINVFDLDRELVSYMRYPPVGTNLPPSFVNIDLPSCATDGSLPNFEEGMGALMHTHNNLSCNGGTPIKVPSPTDIQTFINVLIRESMQYTSSYLNAFSLVATSGGNYMLMYSGTNYPGSINYDQWKQLQTDYERNYNKLYEENENVTQADIEKIFTKFMKEKVNRPGLEVYRVTPTSRIKIEYDPNAPNSIKQTPCP